MAFDVYVGPLTKYYRQDWENVAQRFARENGKTYRIIHAGGEPAPPLPVEDVRAMIEDWRSFLNEQLRSNLKSLLTWSEADDAPYFTDRPAWEGYTALLLWTAYTEHPELPKPVRLPESWVEDPAFKLSTSAERQTAAIQILKPNLWLPADFDFIFECPDLTGGTSTIGSTAALLTLLQKLRQSSFGNDGVSASDTIDEAQDFRSTARFAVDMFLELATKAEQHRLPMILSF